MVAIPGYLNLSIISRTLAMSFGFVKQHPPTKKKKKLNNCVFMLLEDQTQKMLFN